MLLSCHVQLDFVYRLLLEEVWTRPLTPAPYYHHYIIVIACLGRVGSTLYGRYASTCIHDFSNVYEATF